MNEFPVTGWYVSRTIDVPVETAVATFDRLVATGDEVSAAAPLVLAPTAVSISYTPYPGAPRRCVHGRLRTRGALRSTPVEVELTPWDARRSTIGVRPTRRPPRDARAAAYFDAAVAGIEHLTAQLATASRVRTIRDEPIERAS